MEHAGHYRLKNELSNIRLPRSGVFSKAINRLSLAENAMLKVNPGEWTSCFFNDIRVWIFQAQTAVQNVENELLNAVLDVKDETLHIAENCSAYSESHAHYIFAKAMHLRVEQREAFVKSATAYGRAIHELATRVAAWLAAHSERLEYLIIPLITTLKNWIHVLADEIEHFAIQCQEHIERAPPPMHTASYESSEKSDDVSGPLPVVNYLQFQAISQWKKCVEKCMGTVRRDLAGFFSLWRDEIVTLEGHQEHVSDYLDDWRNRMEDARNNIDGLFIDGRENEFEHGGINGAIKTMEAIYHNTTRSFADLTDLRLTQL